MRSFSRSTIHCQWAIDLLLLSIFLIIFYGLWLGSYPYFTPDEGRYAEAAREMIANSDYITPKVNGVAFLDKPVLYYWLQAAAMKLFGINEWAVRFFPALFGILGCLVTYATGRLLFNRRTGLLSALILASSPLYFANAHYADLNLEMAVLISLSLLFFITAITRHDYLRTGFLYLAYCFAALAFLTKGLIGIVFLCMIIGMWILLTWQWKLLLSMRLGSGLLLFSLIIVPWYILAERANPGFLHYFFVTQQVTRFLSSGYFNNPSPAWFYVPIVLAGFFPWTIFLMQAISKTLIQVWHGPLQHQIELYLLLWVGLILLFFSIPQSKTIGYILPLFPALALLTGHYLSSIWTVKKGQVLYIAHLSFAALSMIAACLLAAAIHFQSRFFDPAFLSFLMIMMGGLFISAFISLLLLRQKSLLPLFVLCLMSSVFFLLTLTQGARYLNQDSTKPLALSLKPLLQSQDEIINYYRFYQDLPLYLSRRITLVADWHSPTIPYRDNWLREIWYGMPFQKTEDWLIDKKTFWQRFESNKRKYVFLSTKDLDQFHGKSYYILQQYHDVVLISNQAPHMK